MSIIEQLDHEITRLEDMISRLKQARQLVAESAPPPEAQPSASPASRASFRVRHGCGAQFRARILQQGIRGDYGRPHPGRREARGSPSVDAPCATGPTQTEETGRVPDCARHKMTGSAGAGYVVA
jgi:hypothetical protein